MYRILSIEEKVPRPAKLDNGIYVGTWCSNKITIQVRERMYELTTEEGIRGSCRVAVVIKGDDMTFQELTN